MEWLTVRVYGLLLHEGAILVADEIIRGRQITKFPGGGLEYGEGLKDALIREVREEMGVEALEPVHFYTTDFFQQSTFHDHPMQVVSVYYTFSVRDPASLDVITKPFEYGTDECVEAFRWLTLKNGSPEHVSLPIDRLVLKMLIQKWEAAHAGE